VNQLDAQGIIQHLPNSETETVSLTDLMESDIAIYGSELYRSYSFVIRRAGIVLRFVLVGAIVRCQDD